ncbi:hypothetical protein PR002_g21286 [Phytophthora rubi]|uniref:DDE Tnp4 domain-containing protein n=1 Tax=Phytophthora rubi TaxID=129364 RepID=A0A6A3JEK8_9STRA|nr:hypothetical protein PR002_g21286 [Phytophthora rubi]
MDNRARRRRKRRKQVAAALLAVIPRPRHIQHCRPRLDWDRVVERLLLEGEFERVNRMSPSSFNRLCRAVVPVLRRLEHSWLESQGISMKNKIHLAVRYLAGGAIDDIRRVIGSSHSYAYSITVSVMEAIADAPKLGITFPLSSTQCSLAAAAFQARSEEGVFNGYVAALDGWLCHIKAPSELDAGSVGPRLYFSGHYMHYGINVQACCDAFSRFVFIEATHPGGTNDARAYGESDLAAVIERLGRGLYVVADAAYTATNRLLTPFVALKRTDPDFLKKDSFNFHLSQLRICVEMAFGLLVRKWAIFKRPLELCLKNATLAIKFAAVLHNFVVTERLVSSKDPVHEDLCAFARRHGRSIESVMSYERDNECADEVGVSFTRQGLVDKLSGLNLLRPHQQ